MPVTAIDDEAMPSEMDNVMPSHADEQMPSHADEVMPSIKAAHEAKQADLSASMTQMHLRRAALTSRANTEVAIHSTLPIS